MFTPTWLYIKQHNKTGLKYFGKTVVDPAHYKGSGKYWKRHLRIHGNDVSTIWTELFTDREKLTEYALSFSKTNNIVLSQEWANLMPENGIDGGDRYSFLPDDQQREISKKLSEQSKKFRHTIETKEKMSKRMQGNTNGFKKGNLSRTGQKQSPEERQKKSIAGTGRVQSEFTKQLLSSQRKGIPKPKSECPICNKLFSAANMVRHICKLE